MGCQCISRKEERAEVKKGDIPELDKKKSSITNQDQIDEIPPKPEQIDSKEKNFIKLFEEEDDRKIQQEEPLKVVEENENQVPIKEKEEFVHAKYQEEEEDNNNKEEPQKEEPQIESINKELPKDDFSLYLFEKINEIRKNPPSFIPLIEQSIKNIVMEKDKKGTDRLIYKGKVKVALSKGESAFRDVIDILSKTSPMKELEFKEDLCVELPETEEDIKSKEFLKGKIELIRQKGINVDSFWKDIVKEKETSFLLITVDDTGKKSGTKRGDILNTEYKYIGITSTFINKAFAAYFVFSK